MGAELKLWMVAGGSELPGVPGSRISMSWSQRSSRTRQTESHQGAGFCCATQVADVIAEVSHKHLKLGAEHAPF